MMSQMNFKEKVGVVWPVNRGSVFRRDTAREGRAFSQKTEHRQRRSICGKRTEMHYDFIYPQRGLFYAVQSWQSPAQTVQTIEWRGGVEKTIWLPCTGE